MKKYEYVYVIKTLSIPEMSGFLNTEGHKGWRLVNLKQDLCNEFDGRGYVRYHFEIILEKEIT